MANSKNVTFDQLQASLSKVNTVKADTQHGTHVSYGSTTTILTPGNVGVIGSSPSLARADHTHTLPAYPTALKSPGTLTINQNDKSVTNYNGASDATIKITPDSIGAAPASHGQHVLYATENPLVAGTASLGVSEKVSREDHVHPEQVNVTGNAGTATKLFTDRTFTIGDTGKTFNGTVDVSWSLSEIGAIPLTGSSAISGNLEFAQSDTATRGIVGNIGGNDYWRVVGGATESNSGYLEIATADDANEPIYVRQYGSGKFGTLTRTATLLDSSGNTLFPGTVSATGGFNGNASSATKLNTARSINGTSFDGTTDITTAKWGTARNITIGNSTKSVNGSENVSWSLSEIDAAPTSHTHNKIVSRGSVTAESGTTRPAVDGLSMTQAYNNGYPSTYGNVLSMKGQGDGELFIGWSGTSGGHAPVYVRSKRNVSDANWSDWAQVYTSANPQGSVSGNAGTATTLQTARTLTIGKTGKSFNGSANVSWSLDEIGAVSKTGDVMSGTLQINKTGDWEKLLILNTERAWSFSQGGTGASCTLDLVPDNADKAFRIMDSTKSKGMVIRTSAASTEVTIDNNNVFHAGNHTIADHAGQGNSTSTALDAIYFKNNSTTYYTRVSCYANTDLNQDYAHFGLRDADGNLPNYLNIYPDTVRIKSNNIIVGGKRFTIATDAPSNPSTGDIWIDI